MLAPVADPQVTYTSEPEGMYVVAYDRAAGVVWLNTARLLEFVDIADTPEDEAIQDAADAVLHALRDHPEMADEALTTVAQGGALAAKRARKIHADVNEVLRRFEE